MSAEDAVRQIDARPWSLRMTSRPYWAMGEVGACGPKRIKRYYHAPAHVDGGAAEFIEAFAAANRIDPRTLCVANLWRELEDPQASAFSSGAVQVRPESDGSLSAKSYFRPSRLEGVGIRPAVILLARSITAIEPAAADFVRRELLRREKLREIFYVSAALRPGLEIETYWDRETASGAFTTQSMADLAAQASGSLPLASRVAVIAELAREEGFSCDHISCDLWPANARELTVTMSVGGALKSEIAQSRSRATHLGMMRRLALLEGSLSPSPRSEAEVTMYAELEPSVIVVKIVEKNGMAAHRIVFEEIDPLFPALL